MNDTTAEKGFYQDPARLIYCPDEITSGIEGGKDLLGYATVNRHCPRGATGDTNASSNNSNPPKINVKNMSTLASTLSCQHDQYNRPITGSFDFFLEGMSGRSVLQVAKLIAQKETKGIWGSQWEGRGVLARSGTDGMRVRMQTTWVV